MYTYHHLSCSLPKAPQALGCLVVVVLSICFWRRYVSSLRDVPGPLLASVTRLWHMRRILLGDQNLELSRLHDKHGHFVRIAPNEVSISHPDAIRKVLLAPLRKGDWYKIVHFPDSRYKNPSEDLLLVHDSLVMDEPSCPMSPLRGGGLPAKQDSVIWTGSEICTNKKQRECY